MRIRKSKEDRAELKQLTERILETLAIKKTAITTLKELKNRRNEIKAKYKKVIV